MKVAVSSAGTSLDSPIDPRFGRCAYFLIVETEDMSFEVCDNQNVALGGGAGIQSAQFVASRGAKVVITGNCGPNAVRTLSAAGIELIVGQAGTVKEVVDGFKAGRFKTTVEPNVADHYGMSGDPQGRRSGRGSGMGMGRGMGRGMGMAQGMGMGRASGAGSTLVSGASSGLNPGKTDPSVRQTELDSLKEQAKDLTKTIEGIQKRIKAIEESP